MKFFLILIPLFLFHSCQVASEAQLDSAKVKMELDSIKVLDQMYRGELNQLFKVQGGDSVKVKELMAKQEKIDSLNLIYIEDLIEKYGRYPGKSLVGPSTGDVAFYVLQHAPLEVQAKYVDLILEAGKKNELKKRAVAMYYDRYLIGINKPQKYGTQIGRREVTDSITGKTEVVNYLFPIQDTVKIDSLRLWNGISGLEDYLNSFGLSRWDESSIQN